VVVEDQSKCRLRILKEMVFSQLEVVMALKLVEVVEVEEDSICNS